MDELVGKQLGLYKIVARLDTGGMANIYKARQPSVNRDVAIKVLPRQYTQDDRNFTRRFMQEAQIVAKLEHPHILPVYDFGETEDYLYLVMRLVTTGTLHDRFHGQPFAPEQSRQIMIQIGDALDYAHSLGVIHRDIKPKNILMDKRDYCLLTDFGIAKLTDFGTDHVEQPDLSLTQVGTTIGTPTYMSPEQIQGESLDGRSDIYALGVLLYQLSTGHLPYEAETPHEVASQHLYAELPSARSLNPNLPQEIETIINKALAKLPDDRYSTAGAMVQALKNVSIDQPLLDDDSVTLDDDKTEILSDLDKDQIAQDELPVQPVASELVADLVDLSTDHDPELTGDYTFPDEVEKPTATAEPESAPSLPAVEAHQPGVSAEAVEPARPEDLPAIIPAQEPVGNDGRNPQAADARSITPAPFAPTAEPTSAPSIFQSRGLLIIGLMGVIIIILLGILIGINLSQTLNPVQSPPELVESDQGQSAASPAEENEPEPDSGAPKTEEQPTRTPVPAENLKLDLDSTTTESAETQFEFSAIAEDNSIISFDNGIYTFEIPDDTGVSEGGSDEQLPPPSLVTKKLYTDFVMEVNILNSSPQPSQAMTENEAFQENAFGVMLRAAGENYYKFEMDSRGKFRVVKVLAGEEVDWESDEIDHESIKVEPNTNLLLRVEAIGPDFTFYIDGERIKSYTDPVVAEPDEDYLIQGGVGLFVVPHNGLGIKIAFEDLKIWAVAEGEE